MSYLSVKDAKLQPDVRDPLSIAHVLLRPSDGTTRLVQLAAHGGIVD